jgi:hypothetical protein
MIAKRTFLPLAPLAFAAVLLGCTQKNTGDELPASNAPTGLGRFLLFPNPIAQNSGGFETDTNAYADAYYSAIDPTSAKDTLGKWMTQNSFGSGTGTEYRVVFRDVKDLGYGRNMNGRINTDGSIAFFVENYNVGYTSTLNVDVAIARDKMWHVGTNAIEWSTSPCVAGVDPPDCNPTVKFAKYYNFSAADGTRQRAVDLDGKGLKAMPGPCLTCHGGRGDPLTPADASTGKPRFPLVENSLSRKRGDTQARLQGMNVGSFEFSKQAGWTRADQEARLKIFNQWILCTYPLAGAAAGAEDSCRIAAGQNEWQGTAAEMIKSWYGGPGMPIAMFSDTYVPVGWNTNPSLYTNVVAPFCRTCHSPRGTKSQDDIDFMTVAKFQGYAGRIKSHVFDRGTMPLALIVYNDFWTSSAPDTLANLINPLIAPQTATTASGTALRPGRPVADPGPDRMVRTGVSAVLTGENSLFASTFNWTIVSGPATIANANSMIATFLAPVAGTYTVRLTVGNGASTNSNDVVITADNNFTDPANLKFAHVKNLLQNLSTCNTCHTPANTAPIAYTPFDRNGDALINATDDAWFLKELTGRVNLTDIQASPLLRKPSGIHHNGGTLFNVADTSSGGGLSKYSILYNWILAGMPAGGVVANAGANSSNAVTFSTSPPLTSGSPLFAGIPLDGSASIGATSFTWSVVSGPSGPTGAVPSITNPTSAAATLNVPNVGAYVVQLQVSDGVSTDTSQRVITVSENPITASFTPPTGTTAVSFSGSPSRGNITLTSTSTGSPTNCRWQVLSGPAGATLGTFPTIVVDLTQSCASTATLSVPSSAVGGTYQVQLTASNIGSSSVTHSIGISSGTPVVASIVVNSGLTPVARSFSGGNPATGVASTASVVLDGGGSSGALPLTFSWSILSQPDSTNGAATLSSTTASTPTLTVRATGSYQVQLQVTDSAANTNATTNTFSVTPARGITFATLGATTTGLFTTLTCTSCHFGTAADPANNSGLAPSWQNVNDVNGKTLWRRVFQRVDLVTSANSLLLLNPSNTNNAINPGGHGGGCRPGFNINNFAVPGVCPDASTANYTTFQNWILDGSPPGN